MSREFSIALGFVCLMLFAPLSGCFGNEEPGKVSADSLEVSPTIWTGGIFQTVTFEAQGDLSVFIPYLVKDAVTGYVFNSTVLDLKDGEIIELSVLAPPRTNNGVLLIADYGTDLWPLRDTSESWKTWVDRKGYSDSFGVAVRYMKASNGSSFSYETHNGISVEPYEFMILRDQMPAYSEDEGGRHSTGVVDGRTTYNYLSMLSDETTDPTDVVDGALGYLDRWLDKVMQRTKMRLSI